MRARVRSSGRPFLLASAPNRARTPDVAAVVARSMAAAPRVPLRIEFARVRARALWTPAASPLCSAAPHASLPRLKQKPLDACDRVVLGWDSAFARRAAHDPPWVEARRLQLQTRARPCFSCRLGSGPQRARRAPATASNRRAAPVGRLETSPPIAQEELASWAVPTLCPACKGSRGVQPHKYYNTLKPDKKPSDS